MKRQIKALLKSKVNVSQSMIMTVRNNPHVTVITTLMVLMFTSISMAHTPICDCYDNGDNTVSCEGGFSDGASAAGIPVEIIDHVGKVLLQGQMSEYSDYTFDRPDGDFYVRYLAGEGHLIEIDSRDIEE